MDPTSTLNKKQKIILDKVEKIYEKNPFFSLDEVLKYCEIQTKFSNKKVVSLIEFLIKKQLIIDVKILEKDDVLDNKERYRIYNYISNHPGINFWKMVESIEISATIARWHIEVLKEFDLIRMKSYLFYELYYHKFFPRERELVYFLCRNPIINNIYSLLKKEALNTETLSILLDKSISNTKFYVIKMLSNNLIKKDSSDSYYINEDFESILNEFFDFTLESELEKQYEKYQELKKLSYIIIMEKDSGVIITQHRFTISEIDTDLIGGFLTAIQDFGSEISKTSTQVRKIQYQNFEINIEDGKYIRVALILKGKHTQKITNKLSEFIKLYEKKYGKELSNFTGDVSKFEGSINLIKNNFSLNKII
ncbi:MAG: hypothetical protein EU549_02000 [Promethearchaeota archaeon]|nr:MAG: hypothetical protein EU549_02000 [Candidatus Lokiarchaeota archaeon]